MQQTTLQYRVSKREGSQSAGDSAVRGNAGQPTTVG